MSRENAVGWMARGSEEHVLSDLWRASNAAKQPTAFSPCGLRRFSSRRHCSSITGNSSSRLSKKIDSNATWLSFSTGF